jgi:hypothetical protein
MLYSLGNVTRKKKFCNLKKKFYLWLVKSPDIEHLAIKGILWPTIHSSRRLWVDRFTGCTRQQAWMEHLTYHSWKMNSCTFHLMDAIIINSFPLCTRKLWASSNGWIRGGCFSFPWLYYFPSTEFSQLCIVFFHIMVIFISCLKFFLWVAD